MTPKPVTTTETLTTGPKRNPKQGGIKPVTDTSIVSVSQRAIDRKITKLKQLADLFDQARPGCGTQILIHSIEIGISGCEMGLKMYLAQLDARR